MKTRTKIRPLGPPRPGDCRLHVPKHRKGTKDLSAHAERKRNWRSHGQMTRSGAKPIAAALWAISRTWRKRANNKYAPWPEAKDDAK